MSITDDKSLVTINPSSAVTVATTTTRRVPPPCWTDEETAALVNAYKEKWFALRKGNLRAADWDDVALSVSSSSSTTGPVKSAIQCRHKIEKLRKRYRGEKQRALNRPGKFSSSWELFPILDAMGFAPVTPAVVETTHEPDVNDDDGFRVRSKRSRDVGGDVGIRFRSRSASKGQMMDFDSDHDSGFKRRFNNNNNNNHDVDSEDEIVLVPKASRLRSSSSSHGHGFPLKSYGDRSDRSFGYIKPRKAEASFSQEMDYDDEYDDDRGVGGREGFYPRVQRSRTNGYGRRDNNGMYGRSAGVSSNGFGSSSSRFKQAQAAAVEVESDPIDDVVSSVKMLTEMFVRVENSKMEMMREMEKTRMEMELKHCQMMLESQQQIIGAFAEALSEKKGTESRRSLS